MTFYDITKKYGDGKGLDMMWKAITVVSQALENSMPKEELNKLKKTIYAMLTGGHYDKDFATETVRGMYYIDKAGNKHQAPYWDADTVMEVYDTIKNKIPNYNCWDFYVALNMVAADNWCMLSKWFPDMTDAERNDRLVEMAVNWLDDPDNPYGHEKAWGYYNH